MPASLLQELVLKPLLEIGCHVTGRCILGGVLGDRLVVVPDVPEKEPSNWKSRKKARRKAQVASQLASHLRPVRVPFTVVTLSGMLAWALFIGLIVLIVWLI